MRMGMLAIMAAYIMFLYLVLFVFNIKSKNRSSFPKSVPVQNTKRLYCTRKTKRRRSVR